MSISSIYTNFNCASSGSQTFVIPAIIYNQINITDTNSLLNGITSFTLLGMSSGYRCLISNTTAQTLTISPGSISINAGSLCFIEYTGSNWIVQGQVNPIIYGLTTWGPTLVTPVNTAIVYSQLFTGQTSTLDGYTNIQIGLNIPQCGKTAVTGIPAAPTNGTLRVDYELDIAGTTTAVGAFYKGNWAFATHSGTTNAMGSTPNQLQAVGTNSGSVPTNWSATMQVSSGQVQIITTTDNADTYNCKLTLQWGYTG